MATAAFRPVVFQAVNYDRGIQQSEVIQPPHSILLWEKKIPAITTFRFVLAFGLRISRLCSVLMLLGLPEAEQPGGSVWQGAALLMVPFESTPPLTQFLPLSSASKRFHHPSPPRHATSLWGHSTSVLFQFLKSRTGTSGPV